MSWRFKHLASGIDATRALMILEREPEMWHEITLRQDYIGTVHGDTEAIFLLWPSFPTDSWRAVSNVTYPNWDKFAPLLARVRPFLDAPIDRAMLVKLKPGGHIAPHIDEGEHAERTKRAHLVLTSEHGNVFRVGYEYIHMQSGQLWRFNHRLEHEVWNRSEADRIHLIVDYAHPKRHS